MYLKTQYDIGNIYRNRMIFETMPTALIPSMHINIYSLTRIIPKGLRTKSYLLRLGEKTSNLKIHSIEGYTSFEVFKNQNLNYFEFSFTIHQVTQKRMARRSYLFSFTIQNVSSPTKLVSNSFNGFKY